MDLAFINILTFVGRHALCRHVQRGDTDIERTLTMIRSVFPILCAKSHHNRS